MSSIFSVLRSLVTTNEVHEPSRGDMRMLRFSNENLPSKRLFAMSRFISNWLIYCESVLCVMSCSLLAEEMIPGVLMCRALFAFIDMHGIVGGVTMGMNNAIRASLIILCIAMGVATPNIFFRSMTFPKREQKLLNMLIERRKGHGLFVDLKKLE